MQTFIGLLTAVLGSAGYAILFNVRKHIVALAALGGALCWGVYLLAGLLTPSVFYCTFAASAAVAIWSEVLARVEKTPAQQYLIIGLIPVAPGVTVERLKPEKDDTDTGHAVALALARGYRTLLLTCALGGRLDHTMANLQTCVQAAEAGAAVRIVDETTEIDFLTGGTLRVRKRPGWSLSVFSMSDRCAGVCLRGVKYPLEDADLTNRVPLGVSNEFAAAGAEIALKSGVLMVVQTKL